MADDTDPDVQPLPDFTAPDDGGFDPNADDEITDAESGDAGAGDGEGSGRLSPDDPGDPSWFSTAGSAVGGFLSDVEKLMSDHPQLTSSLLSMGSGLLKNAMAARQFERALKLRGGFGVDPEGNGAGMYDPKKWYLQPPGAK